MCVCVHNIEKPYTIAPNGRFCKGIVDDCLHVGSPKGNPETRAEVQVVYMRGEGNTGGRVGKGVGEGNKTMKRLLSELLLGAPGADSQGRCWDLV